MKMKGVEVSTIVFFVGLILTSAQEADLSTAHGEVVISGTKVTLSCPVTATEWFKDGSTSKLSNAQGKEYTMADFTKANEGWYHCKAGTTEYHFFIKAKVCKNCMELEPSLAAGCIIGDVLITLGVILIVHLCARKKNGPAAPQRSSHSRQASAPPPPPNPDYQPLNPATRSKDLYADPRQKH